MIGVNIDVTEQKLAERDLARANERLRLAIESGYVGGWDSDIKSGETLWFGKAHAQLGMTPDETAGSREEFWARVHEHDRERLRGAIQGRHTQKRGIHGRVSCCLAGWNNSLVALTRPVLLRHKWRTGANSGYLG